MPNKQKTCQSAICSLKFLSRAASLIKNSHSAHTHRPKRAIIELFFARDIYQNSSPFLITASALYELFSYNMHAHTQVRSAFRLSLFWNSLGAAAHTCSDSCPNMDQKIAAISLVDAYNIKCRLVLVSRSVVSTADTENAMCLNWEIEKEKRARSVFSVLVGDERRKLGCAHTLNAYKWYLTGKQY